MAGPPSKCPDCGTKLGFEVENCPNCPWSYKEERPEQSALKSDGFRNGVMPAVFLLGLGLFMWKMGGFFFNQVEANNRQTESEESAVRKAKVAQSKMTPDQAAEAIARGTAAVRAALGDQAAGVKPGTSHATAGRPDGAGEATVVGGDDEAYSGGGSISITPVGQGPAPKAVTEWKLRGHVYDLLTLRPVSGAQIVFTDNETNFKANSTSDSTGRYRIILPPLEGRGYLVAIKKQGYAKTYLNPGTEGVAEMDRAKRKELSRELESTIQEPASLQPFSSDPLITDFHLAPQGAR